jgi:two-component system nitrate/nitrite response regulator NarL
MSKSVLLVDDSPSIRTVIRWHLESQAGLEVCGEASDGMEAVDKALDLSPDLIVMDFMMPRMNGLEAARELTHKTPHVPIILFTGDESAVSVSDAIQAGIWAIVSKREFHKLLPQVLKVLERSRQATSATV